MAEKVVDNHADAVLPGQTGQKSVHAKSRQAKLLSFGIDQYDY